MKKGFTLIELMMAMAILVILLTLSVTVFSRFVTNERREISERSLQEDIRFALELFMREARTGYASTYRPTADGDNGIIFRNQNQKSTGGICVVYRLSGNAMQRAEKTVPKDEACDETTSFGPFESITGSTTHITRLDFKMPAGVSDPGVMLRQGFVTVVIEAGSTTSQLPPLQLETTVTSRQVKPL